MGWSIYIHGNSLYIQSDNPFTVGCIDRLNKRLSRRSYDYVYTREVSEAGQTYFQTLFERGVLPASEAAEVGCTDADGPIHRRHCSRP